MKYEEAIEGLNYLISDDCTDTQYDYVEEIELAIEALEKQIPKKPNWIYDDEPLCPYCQEVIEDGDAMCESCHQLIDWSDEE